MPNDREEVVVVMPFLLLHKHQTLSDEWVVDCMFFEKVILKNHIRACCLLLVTGFLGGLTLRSCRMYSK